MLLYSCHILQILICVDTCHGGVIIFILSVSSQYKITRTVDSVQLLNYWNTVRIIKWLYEISFVCILKLSSVSSVKASLTFILHHQRNGKLIDNKMFFELLFSGKRFVSWQPVKELNLWQLKNRPPCYAIHFVLSSLLVNPFNDEIIYLIYLEFYKSILDYLQWLIVVVSIMGLGWWNSWQISRTGAHGYVKNSFILCSKKTLTMSYLSVKVVHVLSNF